MSSRLFIDLILHIRMRISCCENLSLPLKIFQKLGKTLTRFQQYMYIMHLVILHHYNVTWLSIPLWIYKRTWMLWGFFNMGNTLPKLHQVIGITYNSNPNVIHGGTITSFDAYHKATKWFLHHMNGFVTTPLWGKCEVATHTPEMGTWESSGTPENSELDCRGQNTFSWGVFYTVRKVLKRRCRKWPRMGHSDICSTSYVWKKGRESNY
jgi:hypothetical protein